METIGELFIRFGSDKESAVHTYGDFYQSLLEPLRQKPICLLEVGVLDGASLRAWSAFLPNATIVGLDNYANPPLPDRCTLMRADSTNIEQVDAILGDLLFDIVVDDGCHWIKEQLLTFKNLWSRVKPGGCYCVEDIQRLEEAKEHFEPLGFEFIDMRQKICRGDNVLAVIRKPLIDNNL